MANNYCVTSTFYPVPDDKVDEAFDLLAKWVEENDEDFGSCPFDFQKDSIHRGNVIRKGIWIYGEESCNPDAVACAIAKLQVHFKAKEPFTFTYCCYCSKPRIDEFGGGSFAIDIDGTIAHSGSTDDALDKLENME